MNLSLPSINPYPVTFYIQNLVHYNKVLNQPHFVVLLVFACTDCVFDVITPVANIPNAKLAFAIALNFIILAPIYLNLIFSIT